MLPEDASMTNEMRNRVRAGLLSVGTFLAAFFGAGLAVRAISTGTYQQHGHLSHDRVGLILYVGMMSLGALVAAGIGVAFAYSAWSARGESARIDAYLKKRRPH